MYLYNMHVTVHMDPDQCWYIMLIRSPRVREPELHKKIKYLKTIETSSYYLQLLGNFTIDDKIHKPPGNSHVFTPFVNLQPIWYRRFLYAC